MDLSHRLRPLIALTILVMLFSLGACQPTSSLTPVSETESITWLQQSENISVTFKGMMTFDVGDPTGTAVNTWGTELNVPAVPLTWMGHIFNGVIVDSGPGYNLTDGVHGNVSADGAWVNEMTFSRKVLNQSGGSYFSVTLLNVPITKAESANTPVVASFLKTGSDVQKHISKIDYSSGGTIGITYISTDWQDTNGILRLELEFATGPGVRPKGGPSPSGGGM